MKTTFDSTPIEPSRADLANNDERNTPAYHGKMHDNGPYLEAINLKLPHRVLVIP